MSFLHAKLADPAVVNAACRARLISDEMVAHKREQNMRIHQNAPPPQFEQAQPQLRGNRLKKKSSKKDLKPID